MNCVGPPAGLLHISGFKAIKQEVSMGNRKDELDPLVFIFPTDFAVRFSPGAYGDHPKKKL